MENREKRIQTIKGINRLREERPKDRKRFEIDLYANCRRPERHRDANRPCTCGSRRFATMIEVANKARFGTDVISSARRTSTIQSKPGNIREFPTVRLRPIG